MANTVTQQTVVDTKKRLVILKNFLADGSGEETGGAIVASSSSYDCNTLAIRRIQYCVSGLSLTLMEMPVQGTASTANKLVNGGFETWSSPSACTTWTLVGASASIAQEPTIKRQGSYSLKLTRATAAATNINKNFQDDSSTGISYWFNNIITFSGWAYIDGGNSGYIEHVQGIAPSTTVGTYISSSHSPQTGWEFLSVSAKLKNPTVDTLVARARNSTNSSSIYFDDFFVGVSTEIFTIDGSLPYSLSGDIKIPDDKEPYTVNIALSKKMTNVYSITSGASAGDSYSILIEFEKQW